MFFGTPLNYHNKVVSIDKSRARWLVSPSLFLMFRVPRCRLFDSAVLGSLSGFAEEGEEDLELAG